MNLLKSRIVKQKDDGAREAAISIDVVLDVIVPNTHDLACVDVGMVRIAETIMQPLLFTDSIVQ